MQTQVPLNAECLRSLASDVRAELASRGIHGFVSFENAVQIVETGSNPLLALELLGLQPHERQGVWLYLFPPAAPAYAHRLVEPRFDWAELGWSAFILGAFMAVAYFATVLLSA